jgi:nitrite reductase (cytochrome c-552)
MPTYRRLGGGDVHAGFVALGKLPYQDARAELTKTGSQNPIAKGDTQVLEHAPGGHPVSCVDCHAPETMALRVTRPGLLDGIAKLAASDAEVPHLPSVQRWREGTRARPYDANADASRQELRSLVCGQCHVEYYCGPKLTLFFPWAKGLKVEQIESLYDETKFEDGHRFYDWQHAETGAEVLKAQHPEFETWSQGLHARAGVACADCHMPYQREGAMKVSDHWVRSPLLNVARACQTCHPVAEAELQARVATIQGRTHQLMSESAAALVDMLDAIAAAKKGGAGADRLTEALALQRKAQWRLDFVNAENSMGFHAPQETARILAESIDYARRAQIAALEASRGGAAQGRPVEKD